jgi:CubicO group peptidase (beta-lactamase class C family)
MRKLRFAIGLVVLFGIARGLMGTSALAAQKDATLRGELGRRLDDYLGRLEKFGFSGAVLVAKGGEIVLAKGYGWADPARQIPFAAETVSNIGSITKQFTAAAILKLEMQGKLSVNEPISRYFPNVPPDKVGITIHHLLTHTAGFRRDFGGRDDDPIGRDELVRLVLNTPLEAPPGERYEYSNEGYSLLGAIVEIASGQSYEQFLYENLFKPAGMLQTGYLIPKWKPEAIARGYIEGREWGTVPEKNWRPDGPGWYLRANGGIQSTIGDMYRWHLALAGESILSKEAKAKYFAPHVREGPQAPSFYAYGWAIFETPRKTRLIAHNGGNGIYAADFRRYVDENVVIYAMSNIAEWSAIAMTNSLAAIVFGGDFVMPPAVVALDRAALQRLAGSYRLESGEEVRVTAADDRLKLSGGGRALFALLNFLTPAGSERFAALEARTKAVVEAAARGDYKVVAEAFGPGAQLERVKANLGAAWAERRQHFGELKSVEILGTAQRGLGTTVFVRSVMERGSEVIRYVWEGEELVAMMTLPGNSQTEFLPESATEFAAFSLRAPKAVRIRFEIGEGGAVTALVVAADSGRVVAKRGD